MKETDTARSGHGIHGILRPCRSGVFLLSLLMIAQSILQVAMALLIRFVIDAALSADGSVGMWAAIFAADLVLQVCVHGLLSWYTGSATDRFCASLRQRLLRSAVYSADARLQEFHSGELLSRGMEDVRTVCDGIFGALPSLIGQVTRLVAAFAAVLLIYPSVAGILLIAAAVTVAAVTGLRPVLKARHRAVRSTEEKVMSTMQEDLQQLELIQSLDAQEQILGRFDRCQRVSLREKFRRRICSVGSSVILNAASMLGTGVLLLWGATKVAASMLSYGSLTAMLQLISLFRGPVLGLSGLWNRFASVEVAGERLAVLLRIPEQPSEQQVLSAKAVVFENVTFCYPGDEMPAVENFNARFSLDGWTCLTGISGRGKTTLFRLILGLYTPQSGRVYLETEQGEVPCSAATRHLFAYVPQDYALFSGTVLENLLLVAPDADESRRRAALAVAEADFVWDMACGEQTHVGENNTGLSKGQLQRIAIARSVLMERRVFLLDECTSALDAQTEKAVIRNLKALGSGAILVTHRPEALEELQGITPVSMEE